MRITGLTSATWLVALAVITPAASAQEQVTAECGPQCQPFGVVQAAFEPTPARIAPPVYTHSDADVVPPVAVRLWLPPFAANLSGPMQGTIEVVIDETGAVESARMRVSTDTAYDQLAVNAAQTWRYKPAKRGDVSVKYLKVFQINLKPRGRK